MLSYKKWNIGDKVKIIDNETKQIIIDNFIVNEKNYCSDTHDNIIPVELISFDNRYYFLQSNKYTIEKSDTSDIVQLNIPTNYHIDLWSNPNKKWNAEIYREHDITELDEEVKNLVYSLNRISDLYTVGSCSGHNIGYLWVDLIFNSFTPILFLTHLISKYFSDDFILTTEKQLVCNSQKGVIFRLKSLNKGQKAYISTNKLSEIIEMELLNNE